MGHRKKAFVDQSMLQAGEGRLAVHLSRLRWLDIWAPTAFVALLLTFTLIFHHTLPLWLLVPLVLAISAAGAVLFSCLVFAQIERRDGTIFRRTGELEALNRIGTALSGTLALNEVLDQALDATMLALGVEAGEIFLVDEEQGEVVLARHRGLVPEAFREISRFKLGEGFPGRVALSGEPLVTTDVAKDLRFLRKQVIEAGFQSFASIPLKAKGRVIGTLDVATRAPLPLTEGDLRLLITIGATIGVAVENSRLFEEQRMAAIQLEATVEARTRELQTANLRLEETSCHKSEFLAAMSHELRTPLNSIIGFAELLQDQAFGSLNEKQARYVQNILVGGQHLLALINDLLDLSKVEAGKLDLQPETFSLPDAIKAAFRIIWPQAEAKQQVLELQVADDLPTIRADLGRFERILCNLLSNAVKFAPDAGRITVTAQRGSRGQGPGARDSSPLDPTPHTLQSDEFFELAVQDTGIGIRPEDLPKLFQPFTQIEHTFSTRYQGTGLGLALTKQLVELHGGMIWAESAGEGQGSTFTIRLPLGPPGEVWEASTVNPSQVGVKP